jgi:hypothetical protein
MLKRSSSFGPTNSGRLKQCLVHITPSPILPRLHRFDDRVAGIVVMPGRVLILRRITAPDVAAGHANPQMHPRISGSQAILAAAGAG